MNQPEKTPETIADAVVPTPPEIAGHVLGDIHAKAEPLLERPEPAHVDRRSGPDDLSPFFPHKSRRICAHAAASASR